FQFRLSIPAGRRATVQVSTDLTNWTNLTPSPVTGTVAIQDPQATTSELQFYRIIVE
ncbi:MAG: hypothetical protein HY735_09400, partial [Verrucomicrobia bacterium]|nr:hypothetical protein [Verrucomicrobiota bacterium]